MRWEGETMGLPCRMKDSQWTKTRALHRRRQVSETGRGNYMKVSIAKGADG